MKETSVMSATSTDTHYHATSVMLPLDTTQYAQDSTLSCPVFAYLLLKQLFHIHS